ncbi:hypothetical protein CVT25_009024 [Psilocybe cyanescens]|uniref:Mitochondrial zinc maintenance protein 1, mitochondrial n=1 Tax=Psilocybe cyanescens TaxID=93625 RepID=A0A409VRM0_PSICY|nr:hypothetical protein CVT25_009024 [Psilocybe cyanescens]
MSISPALKATTRSAYRDVLRAASITFSGDQQVFQAFRAKIRHDIAQNNTADPEAYQKHNQFIRDVAQVLRKNVVQGVHIPGKAQEDGASLYRIRMTKHTELGDNDSIKNPPPVESSRSLRRREKGQPHNSFLDAVPANAALSSLTASNPSPPHRYFSALKKAHKERVIPQLLEEDLEEQFVRGSGPLDKLANPGLSKEGMKAAKQRERERQRRKKAKKKTKQKDAEDTADDNVD